MCVRAVQGEAKEPSQLGQEVHFQTILPNYLLPLHGLQPLRVFDVISLFYKFEIHRGTSCLVFH